MRGKAGLFTGAVVVVVIVAAAVLGWAQQTAPVRSEARLDSPQAGQPSPRRGAGAQAIPPLPTGSFGIVSSAVGGGGIFRDADGGPDEAEAWLGTSGYGIEGFGAVAGGYFKSSVLGQLGWAKLGFGQYGISAYGVAGGSFSGAGKGIEATATSGIGGYFTGLHGVEAYGSDYGGYFKDSSPSDTGWARLGWGNYGASAFGYWGGSFTGTIQGVAGYASSGIAGYFLGYRGVEAYGSDYAGYFKDSTPTDTGWAKIGYGHFGIQASGNTAGGDFSSTYSDGRGIQAAAPAAGSGIGGYFSGFMGVLAYGNRWGDAVSGYANGTGYGIRGISASGTAAYFRGTNGLAAYGGQLGYAVQGTNNVTGTYAQLGKDTYKVYGTGAVSFVQNHPYDRGAVVVYSAPEGDEVATYTRGTARLVNGEARVSLGETFALVTNSDFGLTVYVTPTGGWSNLYIAEKSTSAIVVRSADGAQDATFDYIVWGVRIGFEETSVVRPKEQEAYIPSMVNHADLLQRHPEWRRFTSLARYRTERIQTGGAESRALDLSASEKLRAAIGVFDPKVHSVDGEEGRGAEQRLGRQVSLPAPGELTPEGPPRAGPGEASGDAGAAKDEGLVAGPESDAYRRSFHSVQREVAYSVEVDGAVEPGDVLSAATDRPGLMRRAVTGGDPAVVGVVAGAPGMLLGEPPASSADQTQVDTLRAYLAVSGIVRCKADASYGPIRVGDLLVSSSTPGHAMAAQAPAPGTVVGKALEPLDAGTGTIRVLVILR